MLTHVPYSNPIYPNCMGVYLTFNSYNEKRLKLKQIVLKGTLN